MSDDFGPEGPPGATQVRVVVEDDGEFEPTYSNYVEVARSQFDVELRFARVPTKISNSLMEAVSAGEPIVLAPLTKVVLPFEVARGLIAALQISMEKP